MTFDAGDKNQKNLLPVPGQKTSSGYKAHGKNRGKAKGSSLTENRKLETGNTNFFAPFAPWREKRFFSGPICAGR